MWHGAFRTFFDRGGDGMLNINLKTNARVWQTAMGNKNMNPSEDYFDLKGKTAERFVQQLALKSFLTDWCFPNPVLPNGKELCDLLVIFDQTAIIWQIKDLKLRSTGRYSPSEVEKNLRQLSGARRRLFDLRVPVQLQNARRTIESFDPTQITEVFLISVLLGEEEDSFALVEPIKEFTVHRFSKDFTEIALSELDTIGDFTNYLRIKEAFIADIEFLEIMGGEEELLAFYLMNNRSFGRVGNDKDIFLEAGHWNKFQKSAQYRSKKKEDKISYGWDAIIDRAHEGSKQYEIVARELARPTRFERRVLAKTFLARWSTAHRDVHDLYRAVLPAENATYCFLFCGKNVPREARKAMLSEMCYVARGSFLQNQKVIGIATEKTLESTCSYDFCLLDRPLWTRENQQEMESLKRRSGIFKNPTVSKVEETEYPQ
jgi:hypothetical protein